MQEYSRRDGVDADAELGEFARRRQDQADDAAFRCRIGGLADLAFVGRDRGGADDDAALAVGERLEVCMAAAASRIALNVPIRLIANDALEVGERHRALFADDALGRADAGAIDEDARRAVIGGGFGDRRLGRGAVSDVAGDGDAVDVDRHLGGGFVLTSRIATLAPASASMRAVAAPRPEPPPVTIAACPRISMINSLVLLGLSNGRRR